MHQTFVSFSKMPLLKRSPRGIRQGLWEVVRSRAWRQLSGTHALVGRELALALLCPPRAGSLRPRGGLLPGPSPAGTSIWDLPPPEFLLFISHPDYGTTCSSVRK